MTVFYHARLVVKPNLMIVLNKVYLIFWGWAVFSVWNTARHVTVTTKKLRNKHYGVETGSFVVSQKKWGEL